MWFAIIRRQWGVLADGTRSGEPGLAVLADGLLAAWQPEGVDGKLAADGASQLGGYILRRKRSRGFSLQIVVTRLWGSTNLISSAWASVMAVDAAIFAILPDE